MHVQALNFDTYDKHELANFLTALIPPIIA